MAPFFCYETAYLLEIGGDPEEQDGGESVLDEGLQEPEDGGRAPPAHSGQARDILTVINQLIN